MSNQENKETKSNRALMIVFVVLAGILLLIGGSIYLSRDRIQENINDTLASSRDQEMDETGTEEATGICLLIMTCRVRLK